LGNLVAAGAPALKRAIWPGIALILTAALLAAFL